MIALLTLIRRRRLAYALLREYDAENLTVDPERYKRSMETISKWAQTAGSVPDGQDNAERWRGIGRAQHHMVRPRLT